MHTRRVFLILLLLLFLIPCVSATWDNVSYNARMPVYINNTGCNTALEYYQCYFNVTYDVDMDKNFTDLIFYNNTDNTIIPHWNMTFVNESYLEGYLNVTYLDASSWNNDTYYLYYGNPSAESASDGSPTFIGFDDFLTDAGWIEDDPQEKLEIDLTTDHRFEFNAVDTQYDGTERVYRDKGSPIISGDFVLEWCALESATSGHYMRLGVMNSIDQYWGVAGQYSIIAQDAIGRLNGFGVYVYENGVWNGNYATSNGQLNTLYYYRIIRVGNQLTLYAYTDADRTNLRQQSSTLTVDQTVSYQYEYLYTAFPNGNVKTVSGYLDNWIIRKYASPEPDVVFGEKEYKIVAPTISLISQTPSVIYANSTGTFNVTWGISHDSVGLDNSTVAFIYTTYDGIGSFNHSIRPPDNTKADYYHAINEYILRADNRNGTLNFEDNVSITEGDIYKWGGGDENSTRLTIEVVNSTYTLVHWNGTVYDTVFPSSWYLDRTDIQEAEKIQYPIDLSSSLITKIWDLEKIEKESGYIISILVDTNLGTELPIKLLEVYYMNESYDPTDSIDPVDSPFAFYLTSFNATNWIDHIYEPHTNSSYINVLFVNETSIKDAGVNVTNTGWLYFKSKTPAVKPYYINVTNVPSTTNRTFGQTNVAYIGNSAPFTPYAYTPNIFLDYTHEWHQFQMKLYVADNNNIWADSTLETTNITPVFFPPTTPIIDHFHYPTINDTDYDMNGMYRDTFLIGVGVANDPDGGIVTHNLTLHYANETFVAVINNTFTNADLSHGIYAGIDFNSIPYYSTTDEYTMRVIATDDENETTTSWLMTNFSLWTGEYIPPDPINLTATITNDYIKFIWQVGIGNITTSYNVSINGIWYNETIEPFIQILTTNNTTYNIIVWAFNHCGNGTLSNNPISLIESIKIIKEVPTDYSIIQSLSILLIFLCIISLKLNSHLLSFCTTIISWYLAFNFIETPLLAIFFAIIGLVYLLNPLLWLGEK